MFSLKISKNAWEMIVGLTPGCFDSAGVRPDISQRVLGHVIPGVEGVYDRHCRRGRLTRPAPTRLCPCRSVSSRHACAPKLRTRQRARLGSTGSSMTVSVSLRVNTAAVSGYTVARVTT